MYLDAAHCGWLGWEDNIKNSFKSQGFGNRFECLERFRQKSGELPTSRHQMPTSMMDKSILNNSKAINGFFEININC